MNWFFHWSKNIIENPSPAFMRLFQSIAVVAVFYVLFLVARSIINSNVADLRKRYLYRKICYYILFVLGFLVLARVWIAQMASLTLFVSFIGGGVALALHQVILSMAGWVLIIVKGYYNIGDRIQIGDIKGDVIDISVFYTACMELGNWIDADQSTGRMVQFPNSMVFQNAVYNYTRGFEYIWSEISFIVTYESDWRKAEEILTKIISRHSVEVTETVKAKLEQMSQKFWINYEVLTPMVFTTLKEAGIQLRVRYLAEVKKRRMADVQISREVLKAFSAESNIEFAYPTVRQYRRWEEKFPPGSHKD